MVIVIVAPLFSGAIVPIKHYSKNQRVQSLMIEVNRWLCSGGDYSIDSESTKTFVSMLRRLGEVLNDNLIMQSVGQTGIEIPANLKFMIG